MHRLPSLRLPMVPWASSPDTRVLRFALALIRNHAKNEAPEEEAGMAWFARNDPPYQYSSGTLIKRDKKNLVFLSLPG